MKDSITLKWGTLKGYELENPKSIEILDRYLKLGFSMSAAMQADTPEQKQLLCDLISQHEGEIWNDWTGKEMTKEQAIDYITNYKR